MRPLLLATAVALLCAGVVLQLGGQQPSTVGPVAQIHPAPETYVFPNGQALVYDAEWRLWTAGTARITLDQADDHERVSASADSSGVVALLYPVHDRFQSTFERRTFCSQTLTKHAEEGFHARETLINFNYLRHRSILDETNLKNKQVKHVEHELNLNCVTDVISGIFYVASLPLLADATYTFPLNDGGEPIDIRVHVEARERVKTPAGTFAAIRVAPEATSGPLKNRGRIWIWYSDDAQRLPIQMRARMLWGTLTLRLVRTEKK
jgi:Protein of unknown function (DUF3108)